MRTSVWHANSVKRAQKLGNMRENILRYKLKLATAWFVCHSSYPDNMSDRHLSFMCHLLFPQVDKFYGVEKTSHVTKFMFLLCIFCFSLFNVFLGQYNHESINRDLKCAKAQTSSQCFCYCCYQWKVKKKLTGTAWLRKTFSCWTV